MIHIVNAPSSCKLLKCIMTPPLVIHEGNTTTFRLLLFGSIIFVQPCFKVLRYIPIISSNDVYYYSYNKICIMNKTYFNRFNRFTSPHDNAFYSKPNQSDFTKSILESQLNNSHLILTEIGRSTKVIRSNTNI